MHVSECVSSICIECTRVFIFIKPSPLHRLFCSARAYSPWKHQQIRNPRQRWHSYHHGIYTHIHYRLYDMKCNDSQSVCFWLHLTVIQRGVYCEHCTCENMKLQSLLLSYSVSNRHCRSRCCHRHRCYWFYPVENPMPADATVNGTYSHIHIAQTVALSFASVNRISCTFIVLFINSTHFLAFTLSHCEQKVKRGKWSEREEKSDWWGL